MTSAALRTWLGPRAAKLDEIEATHRALGALSHRWATEQLNHAYALLFSSQFQGFCRDLHSECADCFVGAVSTEPKAQVIQAALVLARRQLRIAQLAAWRNAIAYQDLDRSTLVPARARLATIRAWRWACNALADSFDRVMRRYLARVTGATPW